LYTGAWTDVVGSFYYFVYFLRFWSVVQICNLFDPKLENNLGLENNLELKK
jgi:hypothetical protein